MAKRRKPAAPVTETRERILEAALALFNTDGSHTVSTRHIATRIGISPGNLYYHFRNKEEIVLCLYERIEQTMLATLAPPQPATLRSFEQVLGYLDAIFAHLWEFRFFYRDLNALLRDVPGLKERYRGLAEQAQADARRIFTAMVEAGWMEATEDQMETLATNSWIVLTQWFTHRQVVDRRRTIQSADIREGIRHLVALFSPLLQAPQRRQMQRALAKDAA